MLSSRASEMWRFYPMANGSTLKTAKALVDSGLDWISISFDGMGEIYNRIQKAGDI